MRRVGGDEVEHDVRARAARQLAHRAGDVVLVAEHLVGAELPRQPPPPLVRVDRDHRAAAEPLDELERDVADAADAEHRRRRPGLEPRQELLDGVVGGQARVRVRRDRGRLDAGRQRQQRALVHEHVLREAAVARQARELVPVAVHVEAAPARHAEAAAVRGVDEHRVADLRRGDAVADGVHPARVLVPEHDRAASGPPAPSGPPARAGRWRRRPRRRSGRRRPAARPARARAARSARAGGGTRREAPPLMPRRARPRGSRPRRRRGARRAGSRAP